MRWTAIVVVSLLAASCQGVHWPFADQTPAAVPAGAAAPAPAPPPPPRAAEPPSDEQPVVNTSRMDCERSCNRDFSICGESFAARQQDVSPLFGAVGACDRQLRQCMQSCGSGG